MSNQSANIKKLSMLVILAVALTLALAVPAFASVTAINVDGPDGVLPVGSNATFTATASNPGGTTLYQFWVHDQNGWATVQDYSSTNTYTMGNLQAGSYVFAVYALDQADKDAGNWAAAKYQSFVINVGSSVSLSGVYASNQITLTAASINLTNPVYQFWYQKPDGSWVGTDYTSSATYSFTPAAEGVYKAIVFAKDPYAPNDDTHSVWSTVQTIEVAFPPYVQSVSAVNSGAEDIITVTFDGPLAAGSALPTASDFLTTRTINTLVDTTALTETGITVSADLRSVTYRVPAVVRNATEQRVLYSVKFRYGATVQAAAEIVMPSIYPSITGLTITSATILDVTVTGSTTGLTINSDDFTVTVNGSTVTPQSVGAGGVIGHYNITLAAPLAPDQVVVVTGRGDLIGSQSATYMPTSNALTVDATADTAKIVSTNGGDFADRGARIMNVTASGLTGSVDVALIPAASVRVAANGTRTFMDANLDNRVDAIGASAAVIERIQGVPVGAGVTFVNAVPIPASNNIEVKIDCLVPNTEAYTLVWRDSNNDNQLNLDANNVPTETYVLSGRTTWTLAESGMANLPGQAVATTTKNEDKFSNGAGNSFDYDSNDQFRYLGVNITMDQFESVLSAGDVLNISYAPDPAGVSTFDYVVEADWLPVVNVNTTPGNFDSGIANNDIQVVFNTPAANNAPATTYNYVVQRASIVGPDGLPNTADDIDVTVPANRALVTWNTLTTIAANPGALVQYNDLNVANGRWAYRVSLTNPVSGIGVIGTAAGGDDWNNVIETMPAAADAVPPLIVAGAVDDNGTPALLDSGDRISMLFSEPMALAAGDIIRLSEGPGTSEFTNITLGAGNTFTTQTIGGQTLLIVTLTATPAVSGDDDGNNANNITNLAIDIPGVLVVVNQNGVTDLAGNNLVVPAPLPIDATAPVPAMAPGPVPIGSTVFTISFNEPVDRVSLANPANYHVWQTGGVVEDPVTAVEVLAANNLNDVNPADGIGDAWTNVTITVRDPLQQLASLTHTVADVNGNVGSNTLVDGINAGVTPAAPVDATPTVAINPSAAVTNDTTPTFTGTANDDGTVANVQVSLDGGTNWFSAIPVDGAFDAAAENWSFTPAALAPGAYTITVRAVDNAGQPTAVAAYATWNFTVDTTAPTFTVTAGGVDTATTVVFTANEDLDPASLNAANVTAVGVAISGVAIGGVGNRDITVTLAVPLAAANTVTLGPNTVADLGGNAIAANITRTVPTAITFTAGSAIYNVATNEITITGAGFTQIAAVGTDAKALLDWSKFALAANGVAQPAVTLADITSASIGADTNMVIRLSDPRAAAFEAAAGALDATDTLTITAGFASYPARVAAGAEAAATILPAASDALAADGLDA
ncbi:Ig-like domain-containing protein [Pelotomaculum propionicicum]|uniref:Bacterial Ig-like domain-containing protein n=1 Tax=Pelotomaculum propionicicum TaxID=258475 RepID=A0A4Y7RXN1_9FIRM|nr:Ig-like domain-containing protein [Pelotomaculum propionicicum]TEB13603.1 hypothetical protein Pmgp_00003 [Pelotomaculum propionicicum]